MDYLVNSLGDILDLEHFDGFTYMWIATFCQENYHLFVLFLHLAVELGHFLQVNL